jgi:hypothetical protein
VACSASLRTAAGRLEVTAGTGLEAFWLNAFRSIHFRLSLLVVRCAKSSGRLIAKWRSFSLCSISA